MSGKDWTPGNVEEWSVHAQLTFTPQTGNIVLTANEGPSRDSGYSSERLPGPRALMGARATCSVTVAGGHTVTLTCSEVPEPAQVVQMAPQMTPQMTPQTVHFCHHPPPDKPHRHYRHYHPPPTPPPGGTPGPQTSPTGPSTPLQEMMPPLPVLKDAASQTSTTNVPQVLQENKKRKIRAYRRSPARARSPANKSTASSGGSDGKKNPRTVHIDVYCTGSDSNSSSSSEDEDTKSNSTPQTVFESNQVKVMHARAHSDSLPHALQRQRRRVLSNSKLDILPKETSGSTISTSYPSPRSSIVSNTTGGFSLASESTLSSRFSSNNASSVASSWKDTDLESTQSFLKSDSFDYENSMDKLRIREKEKIWGQGERTRRFYKRAPQADVSSESPDEEEEGLAWSFGRYEELQKRHNLKREDTVRQQRPGENPMRCQRLGESPIAQVPSALRKSGSLSDSEASNLKRKNSTGRAFPKPAFPFQHWAKAEKFGPLVGSLKKPGHHVGPSKNPDCSCDTCRYYYEHICFRNRTRSLGDS